jgi:hypothetical protein
MDKVELKGEFFSSLLDMQSEPERIPIDQQPDDEVMHPHRLGKPDRLTREPRHPRAQRQVLTLALLRVALARLVFIGVARTCVCTSVVGVIWRAATGLQPRFPRQQDSIVTISQDVGQRRTPTVIDRLLKPSWLLRAVAHDLIASTAASSVRRITTSPSAGFHRARRLGVRPLRGDSFC